jgi:N-acyl-L-homoserine lactone synthetase
MLKQVAGCDRDMHPEDFDNMFRHRKIVFHDQKKWDVNIVDDEYEIDEYDRDDTCYLMSFDGRGKLVGSMRLISTAMPHMLSGPFRSMFPEIGFSSPNIWEVTRFVVLGDSCVQGNLVSTAACELLLGACQFGLQNGVRFMTSVYELTRSRSAEHGAVSVGLWEVSEALETSILAATGLGEQVEMTRIAKAA